MAAFFAFFAVFLLFFLLVPMDPTEALACWCQLGNWRTEIVRILIRSKENEQWLRLLVAVLKSVYFSYWEIEHISFQTVRFPFTSQTRSRVFLVLRKMIIYHLMLRRSVKEGTSLPQRFFEGKVFSQFRNKNKIQYPSKTFSLVDSRFLLKTSLSIFYLKIL